MPYLLDTNICVFFLRGKLALDEIIKEKGREDCFISEITVMNSVMEPRIAMILPNHTKR